MTSLTIISGTNRPDSNTEKVAKYYASVLAGRGYEVRYLSLDRLPADILSTDLYGKRSESMQAIIDEYIDPIRRFIFVSPEYNGSFPGILKVLLDSVNPKYWADKDACLVGVSTGRAGNLRGMEHLTNILHYLKMHVFHNKLPISRVDTLYQGDVLTDEETKKAVDWQLDGFSRF